MSDDLTIFKTDTHVYNLNRDITLTLRFSNLKTLDFQIIYHKGTLLPILKNFVTALHFIHTEINTSSSITSQLSELLKLSQKILK